MMMMVVDKQPKTGSFTGSCTKREREKDEQTARREEFFLPLAKSTFFHFIYRKLTNYLVKLFNLGRPSARLAASLKLQAAIGSTLAEQPQL